MSSGIRWANTAGSDGGRVRVRATADRPYDTVTAVARSGATAKREESRSRATERPQRAAHGAGGVGIASRADFSAIRYAQCWEDADVLLEALDVQPGDTCLSIASAGDNTLALLTKSPGRVLAIDLSAAQLACLELRVAAYRALEHPELLELIGSRPSMCREELYGRSRPLLTPDARRFWDAQPDAIRGGIGGVGKFERYLTLFRERLLPLVESRRRVARLLEGGTPAARRGFYATEWNTWRWRLLFRLFFSRAVLGRLGRDPEFFAYVEGGVAEHLLRRTAYALTELDPAENPYVQWILTGAHTSALPYALRPEHFETIRANLDRLEWRRQSLEDFLATAEAHSIDRFNLSDVFEYAAREQYAGLLKPIAAVGRPGGRLVYWNMLAPRSRPAELAHRLRPLPELAQRLHRRDKAFFYSALIIEEILS
jgi:S-adenosylmethionine-diacylglycerol 3-amino-3-carboxypropyl transferase